MNKIIRNPITNAVGLGFLSGFYGLILLRFSDLIISQVGQSKITFWIAWDNFLSAGGHRSIAYGLLTLAVLVIITLLIRHKPYDEYHTSILLNCLVTALILALLAIAILFVVILLDPAGAIGKITFFILLNWATIVFSNLLYLLICIRK